MRNLSKFNARWKVVLQKGDRLFYNNQWIIEQGAVLDSLSGKLDKAKIKVRKLLDQLISPAQSSKTLQLQPIQNNKMKKSIFILAASTLMTASILSSCDTSTSNTENSHMMMNDSLKSNEAHMADMKNYRKETAVKIAAYDQEIMAFKAKMENEKQGNKAVDEKKVAALEQQNRDLKKKMDSFKEEGKEKWDAFKTELNQDIDALDKAINDSTDVQAL